MPICKVSGQKFEISDLEQNLRMKLNASEPDKLPKYIFQELNAFWWHFALYKRKCDATGNGIISVFSENCPYPVWKREYWLENASPPFAEYNMNQLFFNQVWDLFQKCPIPHNIGAGNENCDYADDWWYSKNCYLCHSGLNCENVYYSYRALRLRDCQYCVFSFDSELCVDLINCFNCYSVDYALNCRQCNNGHFLFDCQNCSDCILCWNLRNKKYCIENQQMTKDQYEVERQKYDFSSLKVYRLAKEKFSQLIKNKAWWKNISVEKCENCTGDYLENAKNCHNCFMMQENEDCVNFMRGLYNKDNVDCTSNLSSELCYYTCMAQDKCYDIRFCYNVITCKYLEYCASCFKCENCFACCGLVNRQYCILNKQYEKNEYLNLKEKIIDAIKKNGEYRKFFPGHFAPNPYEESLSGIHWTLTVEGQKAFGFRVKISAEQKISEYLLPKEIPDSSKNADENICKKIFWDDLEKRPFQITKRDLEFAKKNNIPLQNSFYIRRLKENFDWMFFTGELRETKCFETGQKIMTSLPPELDGRILSEESYLKKIYE
ncbi:MAG: hypothetical protein NTZ80_04305 [Patescibacteria group bacterium]|nr:hypothetical protein [Patescibacteria group bacterium]